MIDALKHDLKNDLAENQLEQLFHRLRNDILDLNAEIYNQTVLLENRFNDLERQRMLDVLDDRDKGFNKLKLDILSLVDAITDQDINDNLQDLSASHIAIPPIHAYTCDRVDQNDEFGIYYYDPPFRENDVHGGKVHFFYIYGDLKQEHDKLVKRLRMEVGGQLLNWEKGDYDPGVLTTHIEFKPPVTRNAKLLRIKVMQQLLSRFFEPINHQQPILEKKLSDLLKSPALKGYSNKDFVFVLLTLDDHNWDKNLSPQVIKDLYENFCNCPLPENSPQFFFFFGLVYAKENKQVQEEVKQAIEHAQYGQALPELGPVNIGDISEWLGRYKMILDDGETSIEKADKLFPGKKSLDMAEVTPVLEEIIDLYNKGLLDNPA